MQLNPGDIVHFYAGTAGKKKYHLCVLDCDEYGIAHFLFINSRDGYRGDFVLVDGDIPNLPVSKTGKSVISCSMVLRHKVFDLGKYDAKIIGVLPDKVRKELLKHVKIVQSLTESEKATILKGLG